MAITSVDLTCPGCGARVSVSQKQCIYCKSPVIISTFNSVNSMSGPDLKKYVSTYTKALNDNPDEFSLNLSVAICYLKLKLFDKALYYFERAIEDNFDNSEVYFYAAISTLKGKKPFLHQRATIEKIIEYINAAIMIEPRGIYYYFFAYVKHDYFHRKHFITKPKYSELLDKAHEYGFSEYDILQLFDVLGTERPVM